MEFSGSGSPTREHLKLPNQDESASNLCYRNMLANQENTRASTTAQKEIAEVLRHNVHVMGHQNAIVCRGNREHFGIRPPFQMGVNR